MVTEFKVGKNIRIVCDTKSTRSGFNHFATLYIDGVERGEAKVHYINRTWESFDYETVINKLLDESSLTDAWKKRVKESVRKQALGEVEEKFKGMGALMALGQVMGSDKKQQNVLRTKAARAAGLDVPEDFESLPEEEQERRLNKVQDFMRKGGKE